MIDGIDFEVDESAGVVRLKLDPNVVNMDFKDGQLVTNIPYRLIRNIVLSQLRKREIEVLSNMPLDDYADIITREY